MRKAEYCSRYVEKNSGRLEDDDDDDDKCATITTPVFASPVFFKVLEGLCPGMQNYGVTKQEDGTAAFQVRGLLFG
jgi:hypothetical protein